MEFVVKPTHDSTHFKPGFGPFRQKGWLGIGLFQILTDGRALGENLFANLQDRHFASRVAAQKIAILLPVFFLNQLTFDFLFGQTQAHFATEWRKRSVIETSHKGSGIWVVSI